MWRPCHGGEHMFGQSFRASIAMTRSPSDGGSSKIVHELLTMRPGVMQAIMLLACSGEDLPIDVLLVLLAGTRETETGMRTQVSGLVDVRVDLATLAGVEERPGELGGYGASWPRSLAASPTGSTTPRGVTRSRVPTPSCRSRPGRCAADSGRASGEPSRLSIRGARSPGAATPRPTAISPTGPVSPMTG